MTTKRIDELTAATELTGDDLLPIMDGAATTKKITAANARAYFAAASDPAGTAAAAIAALLDSAPGTLDTLNELAAALGDDANFAATVTAALAGKQPLDADLTAIAALTTTAYGRALLELANQAALLAALGTGTPSSTTYLRGDGSWAAAGGSIVESRAIAATGGYAAGAYGAPGMAFYSNMTNWIANGNVLNYWPAVWNRDSVVTDVAIVVVNGYAATQSRIGLYACDAQWTPTSLVADFGTFDHTTSGTKTITGLSLAVSGMTRYLVAFVANGQFRVSASLGSCVFGGYGQSPLGGWVSPATVNFTYGSLPATGPAPTAWPGVATAALAGMKWTTT